MDQMISTFFSRMYQRFLKIRGTPKAIGLGFALGLFIGFTPTMGIQIMVAVFMASLFKWSKITAAIGVQVTNPFTAPFIYGITYFIGARILGIEAALTLPDQMDFDALVMMLEQAPGIFTALTLGGMVVGLPAAVLGYLVVFKAMDRYQEGLKSGIQIRTRMIRQKLERHKQARIRTKKPRK